LFCINNTKIKYLVEAIKRFIIVYTNYLIITSIVKHIILFFLLTNKFNLCFVRISQYLL